METAKPKRKKASGTPGFGTPLVQFRIGDLEGLLARGLRRHPDSTPSETAKADLLAYYKFCQLTPFLLEALDKLRKTYGSSFPLEAVDQIIKTLPTLK